MNTTSLLSLLAVLLALFATLSYANDIDVASMLPPGFEQPEELIETVDPDYVTSFQKPEGVTYKHAILMVENNCKLRNQFKGTRAFVELEGGFYPELYTKFVTGKPRIKFYELESDFKLATVDPSDFTTEQMLEVLNNLQNDPTYYEPKGTVTEVLIARESTTEDVVQLLDRFAIQRGLTFDLNKKPVFHETGEDMPGNRKFDHDDELRKLNPAHDTAVPPEGYDYDTMVDARDTIMQDVSNKKTEDFKAKLAEKKAAEEAAVQGVATPKKDEL